MTQTALCVPILYSGQQEPQLGPEARWPSTTTSELVLSTEPGHALPRPWGLQGWAVALRPGWHSLPPGATCLLSVTTSLRQGHGSLALWDLQGLRR